MNTSTDSNATAAGPEAQVVPSIKHRLLPFLKKWVAYRLFAALVWCAIILTLSGRELPFGIPIDRIYLAVPFGVAWVAFVFAHRWLLVLLYFPYLVLFPLLVLGGASWWVFQRLRKVPMRIFRTIKSGPMIFMIFMAILVSWTVTFVSGNASHRATASLIALIGTYFLVIQSFRWASNPYRPLLAVVEFLSEKGRKAFEENYLKPGMTDVSQKRDFAIKACDWGLNALERLYAAKAPLRQGLTAFTHRSLMPSFVLGFIGMYAILATSFSCALFRIEQAWGPLIKGIPGDPPTLFSYFYFSFLSQATAVPDGIQPLSVYGQLWILWVVMTGIMLLTILIALFTTSVSVHSENAFLQIRDFSESTRSGLTVWKEQLSRPVIEAEVIDVEAKPVEASVAVAPSRNGENSSSGGVKLDPE